MDNPQKPAGEHNNQPPSIRPIGERIRNLLEENRVLKEKNETLKKQLAGVTLENEKLARKITDLNKQIEELMTSMELNLQLITKIQGLSSEMAVPETVESTNGEQHLVVKPLAFRPFTDGSGFIGYGLPHHDQLLQSSQSTSAANDFEMRNDRGGQSFSAFPNKKKKSTRKSKNPRKRGQ